MKTVLFIIFIIFFSACSDSKNNTAELKIDYTLPEDRTCQTYLADHYLVTLYDSEQRKVSEKKISCDSESPNSLTLFINKDFYYISVVLLDKDGMWQSYGAAKVEVVKDSEVSIEMEPYSGGMIFKWDSSDCSKYTLAFMDVDLISEDEFVPAVFWGEKVVLEKYRVPCSAGQFEVINASPDPVYSAHINGFRTSDAAQSRVSYEISDFVSGHGQNKKININDYKEVLVSDMKVSWEFDSKTIDSCETAGITKVVASLVSDDYTVKSTQNCDNKFSDFYLYEVVKGNYVLFVQGLSENGEILFESSLDVGEIEPGFIGKNILKNKIFLKEK